MKKNIKLIDLSIKSELKEKIIKKVGAIIDSNNYILGENLKSFEKSFARFCGVKWAIGVGNGTDALRLCLRALGVGQGDKVLTVSFTSPFTSLAILEEGAIPVFCDIDDETLTIDLADAQKKVDKDTKAIICVHIYGNLCDMIELEKFARKHKLKIIEDACQAHGSYYMDKHAGTFGDAGAFSFYPTKNLGAMGDGGAVITNNAKLAKTIKLLRHGGQAKRFWHVLRGINSRLDEIQAAILEIKLKKIKDENRKRNKNAKFHIEKLASLPVGFQKVRDESVSSYHIFIVRTKLRDGLKKYLSNKGIESDVYYSYPVHLQPLFTKYRTKLPVTEKVCREILAIPVHPNLTVSDKTWIVESIKSFFNSL